MTVHPSLSTKGKGKRIRSVLKRFERLKTLIEKEKRKPGDSVFGLPKIKALRLKAKKAKKAAEAEQVPAEETAQAPAAEGATKKEAKPEKKSEKK